MDIVVPKEYESYKDYIDKILNNRENIKDKDNYQELHHIIPKCIGGSNDDDNLIYLYAQEHYYAHKLLAYENPDNMKLQVAYWAMSGLLSKKRKIEYCPTDEELADARERMANSKIGLPKSEETLRKISENHANVSGKNNPMYGKHHTKEACEKIRLANLGKKIPKEQKDKISKSLKGRIVPEETKRKMSEHHYDCSMGKHPQANKILCVETGDIFECAKEAGIWAGLKGQNPGTSIIA